MNMQPSVHKARILVADDDAQSQRLIGDLLGVEGYDVVLASTGSAALEEVTRQAPDLILLDVLMPDMDGFEVCRHLRLDSILAEVPIILVTSLSDRASRLRGLEAGADDFISKPLDVIELKMRCRNVLHLNRYRKLLRERTRAQRAEAEVLASCEATLKALVRILERNGSAMPGRCDRVMGLAVHLGGKLTMSDVDLSIMRWSVLLQAIAVMSSPQGFRSDEGCLLLPELADQEFKHVTWIVEALASVAVLGDALETLRSLYENWDGSGRPKGLRGRAIPVASRVLSVVLAWEKETPHKSVRAVERLLTLKKDGGRRFDPGVLELLEQIITDPQDPPAVPVAYVPPVATATTLEDSQKSLTSIQRFSMTSAGTRTQFVVAFALITAIPKLIMIFLCTSGWMGLQLSMKSIWPILAIALPFEMLGYWMMAKYPINVMRLRRYLENLTKGIIPGRVSLMKDDDDIASIEVLVRKVIKQTEMRIRTIEAQTDALLEAERQRVMIQSLGTACHHLGQPATVIGSYLQMLLRMDMPPKAMAMLVECRTAADAVAAVLDRLQRLTIYRTEPYLPRHGEGANAQSAYDIVKM